jgi:phosphate/phosphite/phosphonate ABC transporter binding protein
MIASVAQGQFDMAADGITITEERAQQVDFSIGYVAAEQRLLVRIDEDRFTGPGEFAENTALILGEQVGTTNYDTAVELVGADRVIAFDDFGLTIQALISGDVDGVVIDETAGLGYQGANADSVMLLGESLQSDELGFVFPKGSDLVEPFNMVIEAMQADGKLQEINAKWFGPSFDVTYDDIGDGAYASTLGTEENPIVWVLVPSQDTEAVLTGAEEIAAAIEEQTGIIVTPLVTTDFSAAVEAMCNGEAHMGALNTFNYVLASARDCATVGVASVRFGSTFYSGQLITRADTGIASVEDLAGHTFCRPDPTSTSGWVIPSITMQAAGIDPENDLAEIVDAGGHDAVVLAVYNGDCDAGSTFVDARGNIEEDFPDVRDVVIVIQESPPIPNDNISFSPEMDADMQATLIQFFLDLASTDDGLAILNSVYSWSGMQAVGDDFYDGFRQQLEAAGVSIEDLINP